jgi:hypothetical protein
MKKTFLYKSYRVIETIILQGQAQRGAEISGLIPDKSLFEARYTALVKELIPNPQDGKSLYLRGFRFNIQRPVRMIDNKQEIFAGGNVETDLTVRVGQKLVVGKLSVDQSGNSIFLVITAEPAS